MVRTLSMLRPANSRGAYARSHSTRLPSSNTLPASSLSTKYGTQLSIVELRTMLRFSSSASRSAFKPPPSGTAHTKPWGVELITTRITPSTIRAEM